LDQVAVSSSAACTNNRAVRRCTHRRAGRGRIVDSLVTTVDLEHRVEAAATHATGHVPAFQRRRQELAAQRLAIGVIETRLAALRRVVEGGEATRVDRDVAGEHPTEPDGALLADSAFNHGSERVTRLG